MRIMRLRAAIVAVLALLLSMTAGPPTALAADEPASVKGQVLAWMDPIGYATVTVFSATTHRPIASTTTDGDGYYQIGGLPAGPVLVRATKPGYLESWADGAHSMSTARVFTLSPGQTLEQSWDPIRLYLDLTPEGVVTGTVVSVRSGPGTEVPLAGARVTVVSVPDGAVLGRAITSASGAFRVGMLDSAVVEIKASARRHVTAWAPNNPVGEVQQFTVFPGSTTDIGWLRLLPRHPRFGSLSGNVMGFGVDVDDPVPGATVTAVSARTGRVLAVTKTDAGGDFLLRNLRPGKVKVKARADTFLTTWAPDRRTRGLAEVYTVTRGTTTQLPTLALFRPAAIEGQVLSSMDPVEHARVRVFDADTRTVVASTVTDGTGHYRIDGLWPGPVKVRASLAHYIANWADSFGQQTWDTATTFTLQPGQTLSQAWSPTPSLYLDIAREAVVEGQVLGNSVPLRGARVSVLDATSGAVLRTATSDRSGHYRIDRIGALGGRSILLRATKPGWRTSWANGAWTRAHADTFLLHPGTHLRSSIDPMVLYLNLAR